MDRLIVKNVFIPFSLAVLLTVFFLTADATAQAKDPFPSFGSGPHTGETLF
jgi:hypothetical protein